LGRIIRFLEQQYSITPDFSFSRQGTDVNEDHSDDPVFLPCYEAVDIEVFRLQVLGGLNKISAAKKVLLLFLR
jgi:hypothetical protein